MVVVVAVMEVIHNNTPYKNKTKQDQDRDQDIPNYVSQKTKSPLVEDLPSRPAQ